MRSLGFTLTGGDIWNQWAELCCACGLCTLYACPEDLYPEGSLRPGQARQARRGMKFISRTPVEVHPMKEYRRVPLSMLRQRLQVEDYECETPFTAGRAPTETRSHQAETARGASRGRRRIRRQAWSEGETVGRAWRKRNWARTFTRASMAR